MTWRGEVALIMRKNVRELRWTIAGYLVVVLYATINALGWLGTRYSIEAAMLLVVGAGMLLLASLVQTDSPTRPNAFWTIHPHRPFAVMLAKLVLAVVVILLPALLGQYATLAALEVAGGALARSLAAAALVYSAWLLLALVIAAITPDIRTFILVMIVTPIALMIAASLLLSKAPPISMSARAAIGSAGFLVAMVFLAVLYRTRDTKRRTWVAGFVVVACTGYTVIGAPPRAATIDREFANHNVALHLDLGAVGHTENGNAIIDVLLVVDSAPAHERIRFTPEQAHVEFADGKTATLSIHNGQILLSAPDVAIGRGITLSPITPALGGGNHIAIQLPVEQSIHSTRDVTSVTIEGNITSEAATIVGSMPLERGAIAVQPGIRVDLDDVRPPPEATMTLRVRALSIDGAPLQYDLYGSSVLDAVLVDESNRMAKLLFPLGSYGGSGAMVLPSSGVHNEIMRFGAAPPGIATPVPTPAGFSPSSNGAQSASAGANPGSAWTHAHRLTIVKWVNRSDYRTRVSTHPK